MTSPELARALRAQADALQAMAAALEREEPADADGPERPPPRTEPASWRSRLWTEPPDRRIGVEEVAEAFGRSTSWVYKHVSPNVAGALPVRRFGGELVFLVGELRSWLEQDETIVNGPARKIRVMG